jgi:uncharacterized protein YndB with AHSA1/START domain
MTDNKRNVYKVFIAAPIEVVWSEIVNTTSPRPFFFNARFEPAALETGQRYRMVSKNDRNVAVFGEIIELDPPRRMVQTFRFTHLDDPPCRVAYQLEEVEGGVEFQLITEDVPAGTKTEKSMADGGTFITENLKAWIETGKPTFGGRVLLTIIDLMAPFSPKSTRIENWPIDKSA